MPDARRSHSTVAERFKTLNAFLLKRANLFEKDGPVVNASVKPEDLDDLKKRIAAASEYFVPAYRTAYTKPLLSNLSSIIERLHEENDPNGVFKLVILANAAIEPHPQSGVARELKTLQAVVSDMYQSFLNPVLRRKLSIPRNQSLPPLAALMAPIPERLKKLTFHDPPYMLVTAEMRRLSPKFGVGAVGLPSGYRNHPIFWGVLAHEMGGHDVLNADQELLPELRANIPTLFVDHPIKELGPLWSYWAEEAAAEVCGVLNIGPAYGIGAILFHTVVAKLAFPKNRALNQSNDDEPMLINKPYTPPGFPLDPHPVPALLPHLLIGVVERLKGPFDPATRDRFISQLEVLSQLCTGKHRSIEFSKTFIPDDNGSPMFLLDNKLRLADMQESARRVGQHIASVRLKALNNHSLQDIETWDEKDEEASQRVTSRLTGEPLQPVADIYTDDGDEIDDAQLLAGALLAICRRPDRYDDVDQSLRDAFEHSYNVDTLIHRASKSVPTANGRKHHVPHHDVGASAFQYDMRFSKKSQTITSVEIARKLSAILKNIKFQGLRYTILREGKPIAVLGPLTASAKKAFVRSRPALSSSIMAHNAPAPLKKNQQHVGKQSSTKEHA